MGKEEKKAEGKERKSLKRRGGVGFFLSKAEAGGIFCCFGYKPF